MPYIFFLHPSVLTKGREEVHGNAGHVAQGWRTDTYRYLISQANTHVLTIDYRGFGKSTGSPTEADLIIDGIALVNWVLNVANIPPERIVLLGQSLGTAVASAVGLQFADPNHDLFLPASSGERARQRTSLLHAETGSSSSSAGVLFSGIVLVAPFSSLPSLLLTYRIGGFLPILMPLRPIPPLARYLTNMMDDKWPTADRLAAYYEEAKPELSMDEEGHSRYYGSLHIIHAKDDADISYHQTEMICQRVVGHGSPKCPNGVEGRLGLISRKDEKVRLRFQILEHGGRFRCPCPSVDPAVFHSLT